MKRTVIALGLAIAAFSGQKPEKIVVDIIDRKAGQSEYSYSAPGYSTTTTKATANCWPGTTTCTASATSHTTVTPPIYHSQTVRGATLALKLPDGRIAVVNCESKYRPRADYINRRDCRVPMSSTVEAEFKESGVKMYWPVSIDGKKIQSETYKLLGLVGPR